MANVLLVGPTGGREIAAARGFADEGHDVTFTHPNGETNDIGETLELSDPKSIQEIVDYANTGNTDLAWVGPEAPLIAGVADGLRDKGVLVFGPGAHGAMAEGSKAWWSRFATEYGVIQPDYRIIRDPVTAREFLDSHEAGKMVIKASGPAGGKGAELPEDASDAEEIMFGMLSGDRHGKAGEEVVTQYRLDPRGRERSAYVVLDGTGAFSLAAIAQDYKRIGVGDTGKNTGGTGAHTAVELTPRQRGRLLEKCERVAHGFVGRGINYRGVVFLGEMEDVENEDELNTLEANVRFGDPESEVIIPRMQRVGINFSEMMMQAAAGRLDPEFHGDMTDRPGDEFITVCLMSDGYPDSPKPGEVVYGLDQEYEGVTVYQAGTKRMEDGTIITSGGRALYVTAFGENIDVAAARAYAAIGGHAIHFLNMQYRPDIAWHVRQAA